MHPELPIAGFRRSQRRMSAATFTPAKATKGESAAHEKPAAHDKSAAHEKRKRCEEDEAAEAAALSIRKDIERRSRLLESSIADALLSRSLPGAIPRLRKSVDTGVGPAGETRSHLAFWYPTVASVSTGDGYARRVNVCVSLMTCSECCDASDAYAAAVEKDDGDNINWFRLDHDVRLCERSAKRCLDMPRYREAVDEIRRRSTGTNVVARAPENIAREAPPARRRTPPLYRRIPNSSDSEDDIPAQEVPSPVDDASSTGDGNGGRDCTCGWRLSVHTHTYRLLLTQRYAKLESAADAAVRGVPELRMCDECGRMVLPGEFSFEDAVAGGGAVAVTSDDGKKQPAALCHKCLGAAVFFPRTPNPDPRFADKTCGICHDAFRIGFISVCNHYFHKKCVRMSREMGMRDCPMCRHSDALD